MAERDPQIDVETAIPTDSPLAAEPAVANTPQTQDTHVAKPSNRLSACPYRSRSAVSPGPRMLPPLSASAPPASASSLRAGRGR